MKVTVTTLSDDSVFVLDVSEELELENFKAFCEIESGVPAHEIVIAFNGLPLMDDKKSLRDHGIRDGDAVILQHMHQSGSDLNLQPFNRGRYLRMVHLLIFIFNRGSTSESVVDN